MFPNKNPAPAGAVSPPNRQMLRRCAVLAALFGILLFVLLLARLFQLQILEHERYERLAMEQQLRDAPTAAARGRICDTDGNPLAVSASVDNVYLSPAEIQAYGEDPALIAQGLAEILGLDARELLQKCTQTGAWYVTVARKLEREQADEIPPDRLRGDRQLRARGHRSALRQRARRHGGTDPPHDQRLRHRSAL